MIDILLPNFMHFVYLYDVQSNFSNGERIAQLTNNELKGGLFEIRYEMVIQLHCY